MHKNVIYLLLTNRHPELLFFIIKKYISFIDAIKVDIQSNEPQKKLFALKRTNEQKCRRCRRINLQTV